MVSKSDYPSKKGVGRMKCFECGSKCITKYIFGNKDKNGYESIVAVRKDCIDCDWHSYPTKIPETIR